MSNVNEELFAVIHDGTMDGYINWIPEGVPYERGELLRDIQNKVRLKKIEDGDWVEGENQLDDVKGAWIVPMSTIEMIHAMQHSMGPIGDGTIARMNTALSIMLNHLALDFIGPKPKEVEF